MISRDVYRTLKKKSREELQEWLTAYCAAAYMDGIRDATAADMLSLRDEFGFSTKRLSRFIARRDNTISAINQKFITADEIIQGLQEEGVEIEIA